MPGSHSISRDANARNNAQHQPLRLDRWSGARNALWDLLEPFLPEGATVAIVGAGSGDDVPLQRIAERGARVDLFDFDGASTTRALRRLSDVDRATFDAHELDVTGGAADSVLDAIRATAPLPDRLDLPRTPFGPDPYDLVIGDMLYTQLLHAGLVALDITGERQRDLMRRYDPPFTAALIDRLHASLAPNGHAVHVHDVACWATSHDQPVELAAVLEHPDMHWHTLKRHDLCDPHLHAQRLRADIVSSAWWEWPFEPNKHFLVRGTVVRSSMKLGSGFGRARRATGRRRA